MLWQPLSFELSIIFTESLGPQKNVKNTVFYKDALTTGTNWT